RLLDSLRMSAFPSIVRTASRVPLVHASRSLANSVAVQRYGIDAKLRAWPDRFGAQQTRAGTMCLRKRSRSPDQAAAEWRLQKHRNEATIGRPRSIPQ